MNIIHGSRDPGRYVVDYGHRVEPIACSDESGLRETNVMAGLRRAENEITETMEAMSIEDDEALPSEVYFG